MMSLPGAVDRLTTQVSPNSTFAIPGPEIGTRTGVEWSAASLSTWSNDALIARFVFHNVDAMRS